ncbi:hypothetical protein ABIF65_002820 [Bradyrhizobium japonicum]|nr:hypothetical protein [Bradyrhizobium japonicum]MCP1780375.1 hypothetical protein [Bradyrhizobium japonicum]MCP1859724.1 hypothetical protein [Bradyrhizobium japonicum]MCP1890490.1 hypothetical protein [Bradyrhizobium japonicum]MCP1956631.1 hypothetical protein [Bradyrhizobium japonicum]
MMRYPWTLTAALFAVGVIAWAVLAERPLENPLRIEASQSWPRLFGQRPAGFKWIPAGLC